LDRDRGDLLRALVEMQERAEGGPTAELVVEDRPGALEALTTTTGVEAAIVVSGTVVRQEERRPVLIIRAPAPLAAELRRRLVTAGHPPISG